MPSIKRPERTFSFANWSRNHVRDPIPGDQLDVQIQNLIDAIVSTQKALAEIRRDDGRLKNQLVTAETLSTGLLSDMTGSIRATTDQLMSSARSAIELAQAQAKDVHLYARDAENAAISASQFLSAVNMAKALVDQKTNSVINAADVVDADATDAQNWANYSQAMADNAIAAKDEALQWAEYLAGPVVNANDAPAYIASSPFPHGLYYQPVEGYGGLAGLWSAKWWAIYAAQLVGPWGYYYLGGWVTPPTPGSTNPSTGIKVPNPLAPGSTYYDLTTSQLYVWDGAQWTTPMTIAPGVLTSFVYQATAGQTVFTGNDLNGHAPVVGTSNSDVHVNGVRQVPVTDYLINATTNTLILVDPVTAGSIIQWDLLMSAPQLAPGAVTIYKCSGVVPDGTTTHFQPTYNSGLAINVGSGVELLIVIDGIAQEPSVDYVATGPNLNFSVAPVLGSHLWLVWLKPGGP